MNRLITNRCSVCDWHMEGYSGECPQCLADENKLLRERAEKAEAECADQQHRRVQEFQVMRERAEKAEAACAEMRPFVERQLRTLERIRQDVITMLSADFARLESQINEAKHALSTDCGQGYLSPEVGKALVEALGAAWEDILHWVQLAEKQRQSLGAKAGYTPLCPTKSGIDKSNSVLHNIGKALASLALVNERNHETHLQVRASSPRSSQG